MTKEKIDITKYTKYFKAIFFITAVINILLFAQKKETILEKADYKILVQESEGSSNYVAYNGSTFPKNGYVLSSYECANGGVITQNEAKAITFTGNVDTCTLKFDLSDSSTTPTNPDTTTTIEVLQALNPNIQVNSGTPNFNQIATTDEGLYSTEDDYGTSYYWRGAATTNYLEFGNLYWRIIRINGDDSIRIIYEENNNSSDSFSKVTVFNSFGIESLGYMYGDSTNSYDEVVANINDSTIKQQLDNLYSENIAGTPLENQISDTLFCNDRSLVTGDGFSNNEPSFYGANSRLNTYKRPSLKCPQKNDRFTVSDTSIGNGALTYPIGLITADEAYMAGLRITSYYSNTDCYLSRNYNYWTMSPNNYSSSHDPFMYPIKESYINSERTNEKNFYSVPVINLKSSVVENMTGTGTSSDPFVVH